ncbi:hypothetical protein OH687_36965 [Burkholderia anthina]|nr:hypothetical protein OH687_36965 [Burkholderia anthina]
MTASTSIATSVLKRIPPPGWPCRHDAYRAPVSAGRSRAPGMTPDRCSVPLIRQLHQEYILILVDELFPRLNPEIQSAVVTSPIFLPRRPRPTPLLLFHLRKPEFHCRAASTCLDRHQSMRSPPGRATSVTACAALLHPSFKVRTNYETRA